jgi:hypothetical protein
LFLSIVLFAAIAVGVSSIFVVPIGKLRDMPVRKHRKRMIETYQKTYTLQPSDHFVADEYCKRGRSVISALKSYVAYIEEVNGETQTISAMQSMLSEHFDKQLIDFNVQFRKPGERDAVFGNSRHVPDDTESRIHEVVLRSNLIRTLSAELGARGLLSEKDGIAILSPELAAAIAKFEAFLISYGEGPLDEASNWKERILE